MNKDEMIKDKEQMARIIAFSLCPQRYHKKWWGENEKCYSDNNYPDCAKIKKVVDKLYNEKYRKLVEGEIVVKESEYEALLLEQKRLKEIVDRIPCGYVKIADDEIVVKKSEYEELKTHIEDLQTKLGAVMLCIKNTHEIDISDLLEKQKRATAREIFYKLKETLIINNEENTEWFDYDFTLETINELAEKYGIELE